MLNIIISAFFSPAHRKFGKIEELGTFILNIRRRRKRHVGNLGNSFVGMFGQVYVNIAIARRAVRTKYTPAHNLQKGGKEEIDSNATKRRAVRGVESSRIKDDHQEYALTVYSCPLS